MWEQADKRFVIKVLVFTFVANVLSVLLPYVWTGCMTLNNFGFEFGVRIGFWTGVSMFMAWPWVTLAFIATASNFMYAFVANVHAKFERDKFGGEVVGYVVLLAMVLSMGLHPGMATLGISSDSSVFYVCLLLFFVNWISVARLRKPVARCILGTILSLENSGVLESEAKRATEKHGK